MHSIRVARIIIEIRNAVARGDSTLVFATSIQHAIILKILLIHQHYFPEMSGTARRAKELAESFVKQGYFVTIITSYPRDYRSIPGESFKSTERIAGVNVIRVNNIFGLFC